MIRFIRFPTATVQQLPATAADLAPGEILWLDLHEATDAEEDQIYNQFLPVHPLVKEDITRVKRMADRGAHLPKVEEFDRYLFAIVNPLPPGVCQPQPGCKSRWARPQLSAILTKQVFITHHAVNLSCIENVWLYLHNRQELLQRGPDYIFHLILDNMVDDYAPVVERITGRLDRIERVLFTQPTQDALTKLLRMKRCAKHWCWNAKCSHA
jgi:magnesium transporter